MYRLRVCRCAREVCAGPSLIHSLASGEHLLYLTKLTFGFQQQQGIARCWDCICTRDYRLVPSPNEHDQRSAGQCEAGDTR